MKDQFLPGPVDGAMDDSESFLALAVAGAMMVCFAVATIFSFGTEQPAASRPTEPPAISIARDATNGPRQATTAVVLPNRANF